MSGEFSVYWWALGYERYTREKSFVSVEEAMEAVSRLTRGPGSLFVGRVIVTDGGDFSVFEWDRHSGVVFPTKEELAEAKNGR